MHAIHPHPASLRRRRAGSGLALAALAFLAGCTDQPIGGFERPRYIAEAAQAHSELRFLPGSAQLAGGEQERLVHFLHSLVLRPDDDIVLHFGESGSNVLDRQRIAAVERVVAHARTPARLRIVDNRGFSRAGLRSDVVQVQAFRFDKVLVQCGAMGIELGPMQANAPLPPMGCANEANLAHMAASVRDLTDPRSLSPAEATVSGAAVARHRAGQVTPPKALNAIR